MITLNADFIIQKNKQENSPCFLYSFVDFDGAGNNLNFNSWDTDIIFDWVTYFKEVIKHDALSQDSEGQIQSANLNIGNANRFIQSYLEEVDFRGVQVKITEIFIDSISNALAYREHVLYIQKFESATETEVIFNLSKKFNMLDVQIPGEIYSRNFCRNKYVTDGSGQCAYSGALPTCNKTLADCRLHANQKRFGGFPSLPSRRVKSG